MHPMCTTCYKRTVALKWAKERDTISTKFCSFDYFDVESLSKKFGIYQYLKLLQNGMGM